MRDRVLKYPIWQEPCRAAVIEANPKLLKQKIAGAELLKIIVLDGEDIKTTDFET